MDLNFTVNNQTVTRSDRNSVVDFSADYLRLCFTFSTDWAGLSKYVFFRVKGKNYRFALSDDKLVVPNQFLECGERLVFGVYGTNDSERITTNLTVVRLQQSKYGDFVEIDDHVFEEDLLERIYSAIDGKANLSHTHSKSDITDFNHTHVKSEITDFSHTHTKSEITDFSHNHDERYYTESEVDALIYNLNNKLKLDVDKEIIQTGDTANLRAYYVKDGMPVKGAVIEFYRGSDE